MTETQRSTTKYAVMPYRLYRLRLDRSFTIKLIITNMIIGQSSRLLQGKSSRHPVMVISGTTALYAVPLQDIKSIKNCARENSIKEIWNSDKLFSIRKLHKKGLIQDID